MSSDQVQSDRCKVTLHDLETTCANHFGQKCTMIDRYQIKMQQLTRFPPTLGSASRPSINTQTATTNAPVLRIQYISHICSSTHLPTELKAHKNPIIHKTPASPSWSRELESQIQSCRRRGRHNTAFRTIGRSLTACGVLRVATVHIVPFLVKLSELVVRLT